MFCSDVWHTEIRWHLFQDKESLYVEEMTKLEQLLNSHSNSRCVAVGHFAFKLYVNTDLCSLAQNNWQNYVRNSSARKISCTSTRRTTLT